MERTNHGSLCFTLYNDIEEINDRIETTVFFVSMRENNICKYECEHCIIHVFLNHLYKCDKTLKSCYLQEPSDFFVYATD